MKHIWWKTDKILFFKNKNKYKRQLIATIIGVTVLIYVKICYCKNIVISWPSWVQLIKRITGLLRFFTFNFCFEFYIYITHSQYWNPYEIVNVAFSVCVQSKSQLMSSYLFLWLNHSRSLISSSPIKLHNNV
jgi:hypothetical protein